MTARRSHGLATPRFMPGSPIPRVSYRPKAGSPYPRKVNRLAVHGAQCAGDSAAHLVAGSRRRLRSAGARGCENCRNRAPHRTRGRAGSRTACACRRPRECRRRRRRGPRHGRTGSARRHARSSPPSHRLVPGIGGLAASTPDGIWLALMKMEINADHLTLPATHAQAVAAIGGDVNGAIIMGSREYPFSRGTVVQSSSLQRRVC